MMSLTTDNYSILLVLVPFHVFCVFGLFPFILSQRKIAQNLISDDIFIRLKMANSLTSTYTNGSVAILSLLVVYFDDVTINDKIFGVSSLSRLSLLLSLSFFVYDIVILSIPLARHFCFPHYSINDLEKETPGNGLKHALSIEGYKPQLLSIKLLFCKEWDVERGIVERLVYIGHHVAAALSFIWILEHNQLLYFANYRLLAELSTPLLNLVLLSDLVPRTSQLVKDLLKVVFTATFIACRVFTIPYFWLMTAEEDWIASIAPLPRFWQIAAPAFLDLLNIYWGQKIYQKLVRAFKRIEKEL